jgi:hypothetical protein
VSYLAIALRQSSFVFSPSSALILSHNRSFAPIGSGSSVIESAVSGASNIELRRQKTLLGKLNILSAVDVDSGSRRRPQITLDLKARGDMA